MFSTILELFFWIVVLFFVLLFAGFLLKIYREKQFEKVFGVKVSFPLSEIDSRALVPLVQTRICQLHEEYVEVLRGGGKAEEEMQFLRNAIDTACVFGILEWPKRDA